MRFADKCFLYSSRIKTCLGYRIELSSKFSVETSFVFATVFTSGRQGLWCDASACSRAHGTMIILLYGSVSVTDVPLAQPAPGSSKCKNQERAVSISELFDVDAVPQQLHCCCQSVLLCFVIFHLSRNSIFLLPNS